MATKQSRWHGRIEGAKAQLRRPRLRLAGRIQGAARAANFDGPGSWRFLCLDHVREHNARYNFFDGMSAEEISEAQSPIAGWERPSRTFASNGTDPPPAGAISPTRSMPFRRGSGACAGAASLAVQQAERGRCRCSGLATTPTATPSARPIRPGPPLPSRQEWRRPPPRGQAPRGDRGLAAAAEVARVRLVAVGRAEREIMAVGPGFVDCSETAGWASSRAR